MDTPTHMTTQFRKCKFDKAGDEHYPYLPPKSRFGKDVQAPEPPDVENTLLKLDIKYLQYVVGSLLFYGQDSDATILKGLNFHSHQQAKPTTTTFNRVQYLLHYLRTHPS